MPRKQILMFTLALAILTTSFSCFALEKKSKFIEDFYAAHNQRSESKMDDLFNWKGVSKFQKRKLTAYTHGFFGREIRDLTMNEVSPGKYDDQQVGEKVFSANLPITYEMRVVYSDASGEGDVPIVYLVGDADEEYMFSIMVKNKNL